MTELELGGYPAMRAKVCSLEAQLLDMGAHYRALAARVAMLEAQLAPVAKVQAWKALQVAGTDPNANRWAWAEQAQDDLCGEES